MKLSPVFFSVLALTTALVVKHARAEEPDTVSFHRDIRPILSDKCFACHGPDAESREADLRLDAREGALAAIVPNQSDQSELVRRITSDEPDERMPPDDANRSLEPREIELLRQWIDQGAVYETHWSFGAVQRPALPKVQDTAWPRNPIDHFVLARLEQEHLLPTHAAGRVALARRVSLDLVGLPPDLATLDAFLKDDSPQAYQRLVADLLKSPRYGEHWATMWLDAARYADTNGYNNDTPRYNWRYRDWVIQALNRNMPYDQFVTEQLAGDLLPNPTVDQLVATSFNRNHNVTSEGGIIDEEYRLEYVADRVHTTSTVFMALTLRCARCHDHKFDPISQKEYYQFFAFFNQVPETGYHKEHVGNPNPVVKAPTPEQVGQLAAVKDQLAQCQRLLDQRAKALADAGREEADRDRDSEYQQLAKQKAELTEQQKKLADSIPTAMVMRDMPEMRDTFLLTRGAYDQPSDKISVDVPQFLPSLPPDTVRNRLGLAHWLTAPSHPLTARVIVNRLWAEIFGKGLVVTLEDFGTQGASPSHPKLLDWLAVELMESGWDVQHILKLIVSSQTYRQSSQVTPELQQRDPDNTLLARGPRFRMKAEALRDSALAVGGLLVNKLGGPSVRPYQPAGLWVEVAVADDSYSGGPYVQSQGDDLYRRSVYTWWKRTCPPPNLNTFDAPEREFCRVQRSRTNTPLQALVLLNDPTFVEAARGLAQRTLGKDRQDDKEKIAFAFQLATLRLPRPEELSVLTGALELYRQRFEADPDATKKFISVGDSKPNDQANPTELAAFTAVANLILNLDEFVTK